MSDKSLTDKAIDIKGKKYVLVSDRVQYFNDTYKDGRIETKLVSAPDSTYIVMKAIVTPDSSRNDRFFTGYSQAVVGDGMVNKVAALENAETSAVGRALGFMGIGVIDSIASGDEMHKATNNTMKFATEKQIKWMRDVAFEINNQVSGEEEIDDFIKEILTLKPQEVPVFKVKDAVDKIRKSGEPVIVVDPELKEGMENGDIPY